MRKPEFDDYIRRAIRNTDSDDLERAQWAFRQFTPEQMQEQHGQSGDTRQQVLDGYRKERERNKAILAYFEALS